MLITNGARSGKSQLAEDMLAGRERVVYLATGAVPTPDDPEWTARVATHQARRPASWTTIETWDAAAVLARGRSAVLAASPSATRAAGPSAAPAEGSSAASGAGQPSAVRAAGARVTGPDGAVLFDCVGTWLTAAMDGAGIWAAAEAGAVEDADAALARAVDGLVAAWAGTTAEVIAVTNEVGSGVVPATASGRRFRDELGRLNMRLAAAADEVWLCTAGIPLRIR